MKKLKLLKEYSEFNGQRMNPDSTTPATWVNNPELSIDAFDKHHDMIRIALSRLGDIHKSLSGTSAYRSLRSKLSLENQDVKSIKIIRVVKNNINYDVYISFVIDEVEYWGVFKDIFNTAEFNSEVFSDNDLVQTKTWIIRLRGFLLKSVLNYIKPKPGNYALLKDSIVCYSSLGKIMNIPKGTIVEVLKTYNDKIFISHNGDQYTLNGDNFVFFNWWFEQVEEI